MVQPIDAHVAASGDDQVLDADLRNRLRAVADEQQAGADRFHPSRTVIIECLVWLLVGTALWALTLLMWR